MDHHMALVLANQLLKGLSDLGLATCDYSSSDDSPLLNLKQIRLTARQRFMTVEFGCDLAHREVKWLWVPETRRYLSRKLRRPLLILGKANGNVLIVVHPAAHDDVEPCQGPGLPVLMSGSVGTQVALTMKTAPTPSPRVNEFQV